MHRLFRRSLRLFVLAIALLQLGLPVAAYARAAATGGLTQEICTPSGVKQIVMDADGQAREVPADAKADHSRHCSLCGAGPSLPLQTLIDWHVGQTPRGEFRDSGVCAPAFDSVAKPPATGPPSRL
ncbi:MAG: DUF2946 family protein [Burkholderiales bacterium]|nr:DUF2946 family protein [Burkholderiales bacterium]